MTSNIEGGAAPSLDPDKAADSPLAREDGRCGAGPTPTDDERARQRSADFARRVNVEQRLLDAANGKIPLPDAPTCRELALTLGVPVEYHGTAFKAELEQMRARLGRLRAALVEARRFIDQGRFVDTDDALAAIDAVLVETLEA